MTAQATIIVILVYLPVVFLLWDFLCFLLVGERFFQKKVFRAIEMIPLLYPLFFLWGEFGTKNNCCGGSATFSPDHQLSIRVLVGLCMIAYWYSSYKKKIAPPLIEVIVNCLLLAGIGLNIFVAFQIRDWYFWVAGNLPVIILFIFSLVRNQELLAASMEEYDWEAAPPLQRFCLDILRLKSIYKIPILFALCLPLLTVLAGILLLFGQKPDSLIRAFTDTYKHGLSQWDSQCEGVVCGGHFLCTIAAKGHSPLVRPLRSGVRAGRRITCNRQLLISNAFEELLEQRLPGLHRPVRRFYNRIGVQIHRHYGWFERKWVSDLVYVVMKPLEWMFLLVLYTFDRKPEDRIAQQYMSAEDRKGIRQSVQRILLQTGIGT